MLTIQMLEAARTREGLSRIEKQFQKVSLLDVAEMAVRRAEDLISVVENCAVSLVLDACLGMLEHESVHDLRVGHPATAAALPIDVGADCVALVSASDVSGKE